MALVAVGTSYFWLRAARVPAFIAGVFAPAVTVALVVGLGYLYNWLGIFWSGARVIPVLALIGVTGFGVFVWRWRTGWGRRGASHPVQPWGWAFWAAVALGWVLAVVPMVVSGPATNPVQQWDPSFHMNGVWSINHLGDGRMGSGLDESFREGNATAYPLGWHIFTALFTTPSTVVLGANASTLALILLWVVGAGAYTRMLFPQAAWVAPLLAGGMLSMPGDALMAYSQWPNATTVALLPGIASMMILLGRHLLEWWDGTGQVSRSKLVGGVIVLALSIIGAAVVHPIIAFNLLVLLTPAVLAGVFHLTGKYWPARRWGRLGSLWAAVVAGVAVVLVVIQSPSVRSMGEYPRSGVSWQVAFANLLTPTPPYPNSLSLFVWSGILAALLVVGLIRSQPRWPAFSFALFALITFVAYAPNSAFRQWLVAPWFLDPRRTMEPESLAIVPLAALGVVAVAHWLSQAGLRYANALLVVVLLVASGGEGLGARIGAAQSVYDPDRLGKPGMATAGELEMLRSLPDLLPPDARVLGDPQNGSVYAQVIGQREVFFPALTLSSNPSDNETILVQRFNQIQTDPSVCQAVREEGITHFYADNDGHYYSRLRSDRTPGLYNVDTSTGFELVAEGDTARVYRITACD